MVSPVDIDENIVDMSSDQDISTSPVTQSSGGARNRQIIALNPFIKDGTGPYQLYVIVSCDP